jgi:hypothetical protein
LSSIGCKSLIRRGARDVSERNQSVVDRKTDDARTRNKWRR